MALIEVPGARFQPCMDSFLGAAAGVLKALNEDRGMDELWGLSTFGFRTQIHRALQPAGLLPGQWDMTYSQVMFRLGYDCEVGLRDSFYTPNDLRELQMAWLRTLEKALEEGRPAICYGLHGPAFGLIRGLDNDSDEYLVSTYMDGQRDAPVNALEIGSQDPPLVFVLIPAGPLPEYQAFAAERDALREAIDHHLGREKDAAGNLLTPPAELVYGPAAYNAWSTAIEMGAVNPHWGAGYYAAYYVEARSAAATWLKRLAAEARWAGASRNFNRAAIHLQHEAESLAQLPKLFPLQMPESLNDPSRRTEASACLRAARAEHIVAMEALIEIEALAAP